MQQIPSVIFFENATSPYRAGRGKRRLWYAKSLRHLQPVHHAGLRVRRDVRADDLAVFDQKRRVIDAVLVRIIRDPVNIARQLLAAVL